MRRAHVSTSELRAFARRLLTDPTIHQMDRLRFWVLFESEAGCLGGIVEPHPPLVACGSDPCDRAGGKRIVRARRPALVKGTLKMI